MDAYLKIQAPEVFFLGDAHFRVSRGTEELDRRARFKAFVGQLPAGSALFLLGDIFDFFFEYRTVVSKRYFDIFHALTTARERGVDIHFLGGNHDSWFTSFLHNDIGLTLHGDEVLIEAQGRRIRCTHGDLFMPGDRGYRFFRSIMHNPFLVWLTRSLIHPDLLDALAVTASENSKRRNNQRRKEDTAKQIAASINSTFFSKENDAFIMGHVHYPVHRSSEGSDFMIIGDWIEHFTFGRLRMGKLTLEEFTS